MGTGHRELREWGFEPGVYLPIHLSVAEKLTVPETLANPRVRFGEGKNELGLLMLSQGTLYGNKPIPAEFSQGTFRHAAGNCITRDSVGEWERDTIVAGHFKPITTLPVFVKHIAKAQIRNACTTDFS